MKFRISITAKDEEIAKMLKKMINIGASKNVPLCSSSPKKVQAQKAKLVVTPIPYRMRIIGALISGRILFAAVGEISRIRSAGNPTTI